MKKYLFVILSAFLFSSCFTENEQLNFQKNAIPNKPNYLYGENISIYHLKQDTIKLGDTFSKILNSNNVNIKHVYSLLEQSEGIISAQDFKQGKPYSLLFKKDNPDSLAYFIYEPALTHYFKFKTFGDLKVERIDRKLSVVKKKAGGLIENSLMQDMINAGVSFTASYAFSQVFDYTIDFFHLQPEDKFRVIYKEKFVDDTISAGFYQTKAAFFEHKGKPFYAFYFETDSINKKGGFYDENGNMMKRMFLKAPLDIFRITSRFGMRYHPVLHRMKNHFGTDYAAPTGTPIRATASGTVTQAGYNSGNGNYVRIRHNQTYETQYLHMSKIIAKKGQFVQQGEVIGLVGSTGLATGPHVCYRFWKNGQQVDPLKETMPEAQPIDASLKEKYLEYIKPLKEELDAIELKKAKKEEEITEIP